jgi:hypothetical protein
MATPATQPVPALRIRQSNSLDFSNVVTTSPLRAVAIFLGVIFIRFRGPQALKDSLLGRGADIVMQSSYAIKWFPVVLTLGRSSVIKVS